MPFPGPIDPDKLNWLSHNVQPDFLQNEFDRLSQMGGSTMGDMGAAAAAGTQDPGGNFGFGQMLQPQGAAPGIAKPGLGALPGMAQMMQQAPAMHPAPAVQPHPGAAPKLPTVPRNVTPPSLAEILSGRKYG